MGVVEAEAALDAQPVLVGRPVAAGDVGDLLVTDMVGELAADAAERADAVDLAIRRAVALAGRPVDDAQGEERPGRAGLDALAAGDAGAGAHGVALIEHDVLVMAAAGHADDVVDLDLAAGAHAQIALDAGVELDRHGRVRPVGGGLLAGREAAGLDRHALGPVPQAAAGIVGVGARGLVGDQQFHDHPPGGHRALGGGGDLHAGGGLPDAGGGQHPLALDLDHAGAAIAVGAVAGLGQPAQMRDGDALALRHLPDALARPGLDLAAVEREADGVGHRVSLVGAAGPGRSAWHWPG